MLHMVWSALRTAIRSGALIDDPKNHSLRDIIPDQCLITNFQNFGYTTESERSWCVDETYKGRNEHKRNEEIHGDRARGECGA